MTVPRLVTAITAALLYASPLLAQTAPAPAKPVKDPNRVICETIEEIGSRLGGKRICLKASEWAQRRQEDRDSTVAMQRNHCAGQGGESTC